MAEPIVDALNPNLEDKMGETAASNPVLEVSVSFGRFENDSLSWEKWSSFSPNKYLEEVEKCATPGSVAKKAAYFEAHYKKIAARKAESPDQKKQMDNYSSGVNNHTCGDLIGDNCKTKSESEMFDCQRSDGVLNQETSLANEVSPTVADVPNGDAAAITVGSSIAGRKEEVKSRIDRPMLEKPEKAVSVTVKKAENLSTGMEDVKKLQEEEMENTTNVKEEKVKLNHPKGSHKITQLNNERNISRIEKKPASPSPIAKASPIMKASLISKASPVAKASHSSTPRVSKPVPTCTPMSSLKSSTKLGNGSSLLRSKNSSTGESKKVAPKSLHMSFSLGPSSSDDLASLTTTRKSLIMEKMGDKDIVKRAFKTFQNNYNQLRSSGEERSPASKQVPAKGAESRFSTLMTPRKENAGSFKSGGVEKKYTKVAPPSLALKSDERAEKSREFLKKLEERTSAREAERPRLQTKSKEDKEAEIKTVRQRLNAKAISTTGLYRGQKMSKSSLNKEGSKNEMHR